MRFYRPLLEIKAISFDLDDTLYDNKPVMARTEEEVLRFLHQYYPELRQFQINDFRALRLQLKKQEPSIYHDVSYWRWRSLYLLLLEYGYSEVQAKQGATNAMDVFHQWRSKVTVPQQTHDTLKQLIQHVPLVAITNGNVNPKQFNLDNYFQFVLFSGPDGRAKPFNDMFFKAASRLNIAPEYILHVGDDLTTDVAGAINNGLQACWLNQSQQNLLQEPTARILPHIEIYHLASLCRLL